MANKRKEVERKAVFISTEAHVLLVELSKFNKRKIYAEAEWLIEFAHEHMMNALKNKNKIADQLLGELVEKK